MFENFLANKSNEYKPMISTQALSKPKRFTILVVLFLSLLLVNCARFPRPIPNPMSIADSSLGTGKVNFIGIGDTGDASPAQKNVAKKMAELINSNTISPDFVWMLGDNFYNSGVKQPNDPQFKTKFEDIYKNPPLKCDFYAVLGNHDHRGNAQLQIDYNTRWKMPSSFYTVEKSIDASTSIEFFALDTDPISENPDGRTPTEVETTKQLDWLEQELIKSNQSQKIKWRVVLGHHPMYSTGFHGDSINKKYMPRLKEMLKNQKVDLYLAGHDHDLQHIEKDNMHFVVSGGGGKELRDVKETKESKYQVAKHGFVYFQVAKDKLSGDFYTLDSQNNQPSHSFTINKP